MSSATFTSCQLPLASCSRRSSSFRNRARPISIARCSVVVRSSAETVGADATVSNGAVPVEKSSTSFSAVMDVEQIKSILPHRYPFLLVDRVVELEPGKYGVGYKNVTANDEFFNGHFPQRAIMPGVLQVEALAQLGGLVMIDPSDENQKNNFFFGGIDGCRFRKPVVPGDTLMLRVEVIKFNKRFGIAKMSGKAYVGEDLVCEAELTLVMGK